MGRKKTTAEPDNRKAYVKRDFATGTGALIYENYAFMTICSSWGQGKISLYGYQSGTRQMWANKRYLVTGLQFISVY